MLSRLGCLICASADSIGCIRADRSSNSRRPNRCSTSTFGEPVFVLVDRLVVSADGRARIVDAIETAIANRARSSSKYRRRAKRQRRVECPPHARNFALRSASSASNCNLRYEEPEPRLFSFNNPYGACPRCQGFGNTIDFDLDLVIPDKLKTLAEGAIEPWTKPKYRPLLTELKRYAKQAGIPLDVAWIDLAEEQGT